MTLNNIYGDAMNSFQSLTGDGPEQYINYVALVVFPFILDALPHMSNLAFCLANKPPL